MTDAAQIARGLSKAKRAFIFAASKHPKTWEAIRRHAKLPKEVRIHGMVVPLRLLDHESAYPWRCYLTPLGLAVRAELEKMDD